MNLDCLIGGGGGVFFLFHKNPSQKVKQKKNTLVPLHPIVQRASKHCTQTRSMEYTSVHEGPPAQIDL